MNRLLEAALDYAKRGWRVMPLHHLVEGGKCSCDAWRAESGQEPCGTPGKHPRFTGWRQSAATDEKQIRAWWRGDPAYNVGVLSGKSSGQIIVDTDPRNGGDWSRGQLIQQHGGAWVEDVPTCTTGGGGMHEHFRWPAGLETEAADVELAEGFEILLEGHNAVMPPSFAHPTGQEYFWDIEPGAGELPEAPAWLVAAIQERLRPAAAAASRPAPGGKPWPKADVGKILQACAWMQWSAEHAASLSEPQWYAQLSIVGRCENGEQLAHELSRPHAGYTERGTAKKLDQALRASGPRTCSDIRHRLGGERFCAGCAAKAKSPINLGTERPARKAPPAEAAPAENVVAGETFSLMQAIEDVIARNDLDGVFSIALVDQLAGAESVLRAKALNRLKAYFDGSKPDGKKRGRLSARDLNKAIAERRRALGGGNDGGGDDGGDRRPPWRELLLMSSNGQPRANLANAMIALQHAPEWKGVLWRDDFAERTWARKAPPIDLEEGKWENLHDTRTAAWLQHRGIDVSREIAGLAVESVAHEHRFHPVREWIRGLKWDGDPRLDGWLRNYCGVAPVERETPKTTPYVDAVANKWMIAAVARVFQPGCKADCALVLEGEQGLKKSTALKVLAGEEWFTDQIEILGSKDSSMQIHGKWIIEISELGSMTKAEIDDVKAFMSRTTERYRPPYAGRLVDIPRQCVFAGTVNPEAYLRDDTGARRFWPVACTKIDIRGIERDREQLWAEAYFRYCEGATWWLDVHEVEATAKSEQAARYREDVWQDMIALYIRDFDEVTINDIMAHALEIPMSKRTQADAGRVASALKVLGWRRVKKREGAVRTTVYRPDTVAAKLAAAKQGELVEA